MDESLEKLLKELLQKKLHGTLTKEEEVILADLVERRRGGGSDHLSSSIPPANLGNLMGEIDALKSSFDEMAGKIGGRRDRAQAQHEMADEEKGKKK
ncbi:MAG: hypothetical protein AB1489_07615 [Acidobacteriota bacterium]